MDEKYLVPTGVKKVKERAHRWNEGEGVTYCHMPQTKMTKMYWTVSESPGEHLICKKCSNYVDPDEL